MKTIVIADRDEGLVKSLELFLQEYYQISTVKNERELLETLKKQDVDLLLSDLRISNTSSFSIFRKIKQIAPKLPIILMYVYFDEGQEKELTLREVVDAVIHKPFNVEDVIDLIEKFVNKNNRIFTQQQ